MPERGRGARRRLILPLCCYRLGMREPKAPDRNEAEESLARPVEAGAVTGADDGQVAQEGRRSSGRRSVGGVLQSCLTWLQAAVAISLLVVAAVVLVRTVVTFLDQPGNYPASLISALDGILVVIIIVDVLHTVITHLRDAEVPVKPFLVIGVLAGIRDVLSASARLELIGHQSTLDFNQSVIELGVGVAVVLVLLGGLLLLRFASEPAEPSEPSGTAKEV